MSTPRSVHPGLKAALEFGPIIAFFAGYVWLKERTFLIGGTEYDGFIVVTAAFVPLILITTAILWKLTGHLSRMQIMTAVLVTVFGGLSVWLNDDRFFKMKPTMIYTLSAAVLGVGLLRGRSYLSMVMGELMPLTDAGWMILTKRLAWFFAGLAVLNEVIWRTMSTDAWVNFKTFGLTLAIFGFFVAQSRLIETHGTPEESPEEDA